MSKFKRNVKESEAYSGILKQQKLDKIKRALAIFPEKDRKRILNALILKNSGAHTAKCSCGAVNFLEPGEYQQYIKGNLGCGKCSKLLVVVN